MFCAKEHISRVDMSYGMYGRGRGLRMGLGPNLSSYCRWSPSMPRGWWANPTSQTSAPIANIMGQPDFGVMPYQTPPCSMPYQSPVGQYPPPATVPSVTPQQFQPAMPSQQPYFAPQMQYGLKMGRSLGGGRGMGMGYRRRMGRFSGGMY